MTGHGVQLHSLEAGKGGADLDGLAQLVDRLSSVGALHLTAPVVKATDRVARNAASAGKVQMFTGR